MEIWYSPIGKDACSSILDLQLLMAYQYATKLEADAGYEALSKIYRQKAELLSGTIQLKYWDVEKKCMLMTVSISPIPNMPIF